MFDLLAVTWGFLQCFDDHGWGTGDDGHFGLSVLDGQLDGDLQTLPVLGCLGDVITNFFWRLLEVTKRWQDSEVTKISIILDKMLSSLKADLDTKHIQTSSKTMTYTEWVKKVQFSNYGAIL